MRSDQRVHLHNLQHVSCCIIFSSCWLVRFIPACTVMYYNKIQGEKIEMRAITELRKAYTWSSIWIPQIKAPWLFKEMTYRVIKHVCFSLCVSLYVVALACGWRVWRPGRLLLCSGARDPGAPRERGDVPAPPTGRLHLVVTLSGLMKF